VNFKGIKENVTYFLNTRLYKPQAKNGMAIKTKCSCAIKPARTHSSKVFCAAFEKKILSSNERLGKETLLVLRKPKFKARIY